MKLSLSIFLVCLLHFFQWPPEQSSFFEKNRPDASFGADSCELFEWTQLSDRIFPEWRDGIATIVRDDDLYIIGGWNPRAFESPYTSTTNEIWRSTDGGNHWTLFSKAAFSPRHTFVCIDADDGYVYVIGGDQYNSETERAEVWRSKDLIDWELVTNQSPFGNRMLMAGVTYKGRFFVGGGQGLPDFAPGKTDMYVSDDKGVTWQCLSDSLAHMGQNIVGTMHVFNDRIYQVSGGWYGNQRLTDFSYRQEVYSTADGTNWVKESPIPMPGVQYPNTVVFDDKLWCVGGSSVVSGLVADAYNKNDICYMGTDGVWQLLETATEIPNTHASSLVVYRQSLLLLAGNQLNGVYKLIKR